jgi:hypothetical protein
MIQDFRFAFRQLWKSFFFVKFASLSSSSESATAELLRRAVHSSAPNEESDE